MCVVFNSVLLFFDVCIYQICFCSYFDSFFLLWCVKIVIIDFGGFQKEVFFLGCLVIILRCEIEWCEFVVSGWNVFVLLSFLFGDEFRCFVVCFVFENVDFLVFGGGYVVQEIVWYFVEFLSQLVYFVSLMFDYSDFFVEVSVLYYGVLVYFGDGIGVRLQYCGCRRMWQCLFG